jgi:hypothetical protein
VLYSSVFAEFHPRRSPNSFLTLAPIPCPLSRKSFPFIFFADPHPLTPLQSYRFKNSGGRPHSGLWIDSTSSHLPYTLPSSVSRKSFTCRSYENTGVCGYSSRFGTRRRADVSTGRRFTIPCLFILLRTLLRAAKTQLLSFQAILHSLPKTTRGGGYSVFLNSQQPNFFAANGKAEGATAASDSRMGAAFAGRRETEGSLETPRNIFEMNPLEIGATKVLTTMVGGRLV